ncbi:MAG TPA: hypothetical protein VFO91_12070, partial [Anaerolineales bacterium]|nr:hypothetical protein [Anaerolineales bacterium]
METKSDSLWKDAAQAGLLGGGVAVLLSLVGMVATFSGRYVVSGVFTMGQVLFMAPILLSAYASLRRIPQQPASRLLLAGLLSGLIGSAVLATLVLIGNAVNLRTMFINASPDLYRILTFGQGVGIGILILLTVGLLLGAAAAGILLLPERLRGALTQAILWVLLTGLLRDLIVTVSLRWGPLAGIIRQFFAVSGLTLVGAIILFLLIGGISYWRLGRPKGEAEQVFNQQRPVVRWLTLGAIGIVLLL